MQSFILTCCSTVDMPKEYFEENNLPCAYYHYILDGEEHLDDCGQTIPFDEFYERIRNGAMPTTSQINASEFAEFFEPFLQAGQDVLHVSMSSGISGTCNSAFNAANDLREKYPERTILVVDSLAASAGYGLLVDALVTMRDNGATIEEAYNFAEENKLKVNHWFYSTDLTHFKRGGRISATAATVGNLLNLCPFMNVSNVGSLIVREKIRGKKKVLQHSYQTMEKLARDGKNYNGKCFISTADCYDEACQLAKLIEENMPNLDGKVQISSIGTIIGSHTGPGTVALFFWGEDRID